MMWAMWSIEERGRRGARKKEEGCQGEAEKCKREKTGTRKRRFNEKSGSDDSRMEENCTERGNRKRERTQKGGEGHRVGEEGIKTEGRRRKRETVTDSKGEKSVLVSCASTTEVMK